MIEESLIYGTSFWKGRKKAMYLICFRLKQYTLNWGSGEKAIWATVQIRKRIKDIVHSSSVNHLMKESPPPWWARTKLLKKPEIHGFATIYWGDVSHQFSSVTQSCPTLCVPMNYSTSGLPAHHQLPESIQTHVYQVGDAIQPSHPLLSSSPPALNLSQHQGLFKWVSALRIRWPKYWSFSFSTSQSFQWIFRVDFL